MKYTRFEVLVLGIGAISIFGSILFAAAGPPIAEEVIAQALLFAVLAAAVYGGRTAGFIAALVASAAYLLLRVPLVMADQGLSLDLAGILAIRILGYGVIGIIGGEACDRIRSMLSEYKECRGMDSWSGTCNQRFIARVLAAALGESQRYDTVFSVAIIDVSPAVFRSMSTTRQRAIVRAIADHIKDDIRVVDEVGRLDEGSFLLVLPHTPVEGALVAADRLRRGVRNVIGAGAESITVRTLSVPGNIDEIHALSVRLGKSAEAADQGVSSSP